MTQFAPVPRDCLVCGSSSKSAIYTQHFVGLSDAVLLDGYDVVVCNDCGLGYADELPPQEAFNNYYRDLSKYESPGHDGALSAYDLIRFPETVGLIAGAIADRNVRVLEIGCSTGGLLQALQAGGYKKIVGLDPSPVCTRIARERCGAETITGSLSDLRPEHGPFEVIILGSVLEHLRDMEATMRTLTSLLAPGGHLYLEVPDASRFAEHTQAPFQEFSLEHINYFSPRSLDNLLGANGFTPVFAHQGTPETRPGVFAFEIKAMYRMTGATSRPVRDTVTGPALTAYVEKCRSMERGLAPVLDKLAATKRPILVWGVGTHTQHLLKSSPLRDANIVAFVDSNPNYQGRTLHGSPVLAPAALSSRPEPILISSHQFQEEISSQIRNGLGLKNEIILLY
ncbi:MAG TPA: class I SAM-dependent methyltransferase [Gemmatimonadaceae bacterium]|jgi:SAM-dependent methyltransferase